MKKIIKLIVLLNIIGLNAQESIKYSLKINYDIYFNTELPNKKKGTLFIDNDFSKSIFIYGKNKGKSIEENNEEKTLNLKYAESERFNYFNSINDSLYSKEKIITNEFIIAEKAENLNWFLSSETKKIDNLTVKKATLKFRGRNYIAWYSMDYPLNFGPWKFNKLPGLILEIYDENQR
ncbi:MAG: GLPGLI family protein, partial [Polaribacter sp.]